jgi:hypothetical protein
MLMVYFVFCRMTDRTPHESLPVKAGTKRQYFRLVRADIFTMSKLLPVLTKSCAQVAGPVGVWYSAHSNANPDPRYRPQAKIIDGNKFAQSSTVEGADETCFCLQGEIQKTITAISKQLDEHMSE